MEIFKERVFAEVRKIPAGKVSTYKNISQAVGVPPVVIGQMLKKNRDPAVPYHRVVKSDGSLGGYVGGGKKNEEKKRKILETEGIDFENGRVKNECFFTA